MITLQELFDDISHGEFANMSVGNSRTGTLTPEIYPRIISLFNSGLHDLYTRFLLKEKEFDLHMRTGVTKYFVRSEHVGDPNGGDLNIYVDGTGVDPIANDIIKITEAYRSDGTQLQINKRAFPYDIFMPEPDVIKIKPDPDAVYENDIISLVYQASYPRIQVTSGMDPRNMPLYIPGYLKTALLCHVAARFFVGKTSNAGEGQPSLNSTFLYKYETECQRIEKNSLTQDVEEEDERFERNGFI